MKKRGRGEFRFDGLDDDNCRGMGEHGDLSSTYSVLHPGARARKKLQGKAADVYSRPEESGELTKKYIECYNALLIFGEQVSAQKLDEQTEQIEKLMAEVEKLRKENAIVHQLRIEKDEITQTLQDVLMHLEKLEQGNTKHF